MSPVVSFAIVFLLAIGSAILVIFLSVFPFRQELFHCLGKRSARKGRNSLILGQEMTDFRH